MHGTSYGYMRHYRDRERPCEPCAMAHREQMRAEHRAAAAGASKRIRDGLQRATREPGKLAESARKFLPYLGGGPVRARDRWAHRILKAAGDPCGPPECGQVSGVLAHLQLARRPCVECDRVRRAVVRRWLRLAVRHPWRMRRMIRARW